MAIFGRTKKDTSQATSSKKEELSTATAKKITDGKAKVAQNNSSSNVRAVKGVAHILRRPRITEKATLHTEKGAYLFDVAPSATKHEIARAVSAVYNVTPRMVHIVTVPAKQKRSARTGGLGVKSGGKKAYVYLKKGETITVS